MHPIRSPAVITKNRLDALFQEGKEDKLKPPSIYSLSVQQRTESDEGKGSPQRVMQATGGGHSSNRTNSADALKL